MATATKKTAAKAKTPAAKPAAKKAVKPAAAAPKKPAIKPAKPSAKKEADSVTVSGASAIDCLLATQTSLLNMADNIHVCLTALQSELKEARAKAAAGKKKAKK